MITASFVFKGVLLCDLMLLQLIIFTSPSMSFLLTLAHAHDFIKKVIVFI